MSAATMHHAVRTEVDVAADAVWALFRAGLIQQTPANIAAAARAARISPADLRAASERRPYYSLPTARHVARDDLAIPLEAAEILQAERAVDRAVEPTIRREQRAVRDVLATHPPRARTAHTERHRCPKCRRPMPLTCYLPNFQGDGWGSWCRDCRKARKDRLALIVERAKPQNAAKVTFTVSPSHDVDELRCVECLGPLEPGQDVCSSSSLRHVTCPDLTSIVHIPSTDSSPGCPPIAPQGGGVKVVA